MICRHTTLTNENMKQIRLSNILVAVLLVVPAGIGGSSIAAEPHERPNVLFIISDDQERREFNFLPEGRDEDGMPRNLSPNLDRLATEGVIFPNQYVTSPVCTPSRFTVLAGTYASRSPNFNKTVKDFEAATAASH